MDAITWLKRLVAVDTTSSHSNLALIDAVSQYVKNEGLDTRFTFNKERTKANLLVTIPSLTGVLHGGLVLSGHTDVVPVTGQQWDTPPFELTRQGDRFYGRGTSDMKGFIAVVLSLIPEIKTLSLTSPVHLALSFDEEVGCIGAPRLIKDMVDAGIKPAFCIVGEPTEMYPVIAHKGIQSYRCVIRGLSAHSSLTNKGCNAIEYAARLICFIRELADELRNAGPQDALFDVGFTTVTTNRINGGMADNIIPDYCEFMFEFRHLPQVDPMTIVEKIQAYANQTILPSMQAEYSGAELAIHQLNAVPSFEAKEASEIIRKIHELQHRREIKKVAYATEAGLFQFAGMETIVCGPGSIQQAHRANEYIELAQLKECEEFLRNFIQIYDHS